LKALTQSFLGEPVHLGGDFERVSGRVRVDFADQQSPSLLDVLDQLFYKLKKKKKIALNSIL
jgi:hypothetical protein